ncbi:MAG: arginine deiminase [Oscillospiraceae bacterium]|nr:arginine deiminase [Oscillospiraceae bacterium]
MAICVNSEIGPLKRVLLHRPGKELEHLVPQELERLLFDDIPYLALARNEHDRFAGILRENGAEVVYLEDLMAETLQVNPGLKEIFIRQFLAEAGPVANSHMEELSAVLSEITDEKELILKTMSGVTADELRGRLTEGPLVRLTSGTRQFVLDPIPNLYFTRDPFASIGCGVSLHRMYSPTRCRETIYGQFILKYHPDFSGKVPLYYDRSCPFSIEGGDILNLSHEVLAIGVSQRTSPEGIERLAANLFREETSSVKKILVMDIPNFRAFMHLDTVFTQVDRDKFSIHPEILRSLRIYEICQGCGGERIRARERTESLEDVLRDALGLDRVTLIRCGGKDIIASAREQWNDGANTLCIAPGKVVVYNRNYVTNEILRDSGVEVYEMPSSELARGRGGPRCMSMPLVREAPGS